MIWGPNPKRNIADFPPKKRFISKSYSAFHSCLQSCLDNSEKGEACLVKTARNVANSTTYLPSKVCHFSPQITH